MQATKTEKRPKGARLGRRQLAENLCPCLKKRKASQCDCQLCTYVEDNVRRWHKARRGWHGPSIAKGQPCDCHIHSALHTPALEAEEALWLAAVAAAAA